MLTGGFPHCPRREGKKARLIERRIWPLQSRLQKHLRKHSPETPVAGILLQGWQYYWRMLLLMPTPNIGAYPREGIGGIDTVINAIFLGSVQNMNGVKLVLIPRKHN